MDQTQHHRVSSFSADERKKWYSKPRPHLLAYIGKQQSDPMAPYNNKAGSSGSSVSSERSLPPSWTIQRTSQRRSHSLDERSHDPRFPQRPRTKHQGPFDDRNWSHPIPTVKLPPILPKQVRFQGEQRQSVGAYRNMRQQQNNDS